jgi:hypothetical protein
MNKRDAKQRSYTITRQEVEDILRAVEHPIKGYSRVNRSVTKGQAYQILSDGFFSGNPERPLRPGDLTVINILREFA